ncbi:hypothetical protein PRIC2_002165 [Phytophthora ramorum]
MVREEVVIDGDSTDEDEVRIITPQSRKRRRRSNILVDHDEEEEEEEEEEETNEPQVKTVTSSAPRRQQQLSIGSDGVSSQPMMLRTPTPTRRSRRNLQQLSISAAVARGDRGRHQREEDAEDEEGEEDDDVRIVPPPSAGSVRSSGSSGRKSRRPAIQDSDEELEKEQEVRVQEDGDDETSSASRRSSRIQHKRQEKEKQHGIARKLDYPVLDNCLDTLQSLGPHFKGRDGDDENDEDYQVEDDSEPEEAPPPLKKKRRSLPREGERDHREKVYADGGEDMDDFICDDDEVEYMEDGEEGVISVEASDDEMGGDDPHELAAMMEVGRSREMIEWFTIYMEYLEECIIDPELEAKMRRKQSKPQYQLYQQAADRVERRICSCRDTVRSGVAWPDEMVEALKCASQYRSGHVSGDQDCDACNRRQHVATYHVELAGAACDATKLYGHNWMHRLKEAAQEADPVQVSFEMGSVCHARTLAYWQLLHAKQFWCILIDAKIKQCADSTGRIAQLYRDEFFKKEFGRYKKLVGLVEKFADDSKRITVYMPNSWKGISRRTVTSDFLPLLSRVSSYSASESRRGNLDAFVGDSEEEDTEDEEAVMEKTEKEKRAAASGSNDDNQATDDEEEVKDVEVSSSRRTPLSESKKEQKLHHPTKEESEKKEEPQAKDEKSMTKESAPEKDIDDLKCLVCDASPRNAGVVHGLYLHVYCCYACAKRLHRLKLGCMVCNRPIDRVLRLLPLTLDARNAIRNQNKS